MQRKRILLPVDLSSRSSDALLFTRQMAAELPVRVTLLSVVTLNVSVAESRVYAGLRSEAEAALRRLGGLLFDERTPVNVSVRVGRPPEQIIAEAESERPELIVMSAPKPSRWGRWLGQGIVEAVVRGAPCPALVLPRQWQITPEQYRQAFRPATVEMGRGTRPWASCGLG